MIHIVTGKINSGKTTRLTDLYQNNHAGDGFVSVKRMHYNKVHGYDLMRLSDQSTHRFVIHQDYYNDIDPIDCQIGPYLFYADVVGYVEDQVNTWIEQDVSPIYLDEIGMLELHDKCFASALKQCIHSGVETYITVRHDLVDDVINTFQIKDVNILLD